MITLSRREFLAGMPAVMLASRSGSGESEESFLDDLSRRSFLFFWEQADPGTGLVRDRALADSAGPDARRIASIAATGFGLTALAIGAERGWISREQARERALTTLRFFAGKSVHEHGWFYHFMDAGTGGRWAGSEVSSIDTILLLAGMLTMRGYFPGDAEIGKQVRGIWERIDLQWMLDDYPHLLSMGWLPETGFINSRWDHVCELGILYLLGIASPGNPLPIDSWYAWRRPTVSYRGYEYISGAPPLFVHQYSQAWVDFRKRRERRAPGTNWFENSVKATLAHRQFCIDLRERFPGYEDNIWGITASDSARGYEVWGGPPGTSNIDGTVVPCAAGGSLMLAPEVCLPAVMAMRRKYGERIYKRYGFVDAFHPRGWTDRDVIGIDVGITLLSAENLRTGSVWRWFHRNPEVESAMERIFEPA
jgi:hypothetical protein